MPSARVAFTAFGEKGRRECAGPKAIKFRAWFAGKIVERNREQSGAVRGLHRDNDGNSRSFSIGEFGQLCQQAGIFRGEERKELPVTLKIVVGKDASLRPNEHSRRDRPGNAAGVVAHPEPTLLRGVSRDEKTLAFHARNLARGRRRFDETPNGCCSVRCGAGPITFGFREKVCAVLS